MVDDLTFWPIVKRGKTWLIIYAAEKGLSASAVFRRGFWCREKNLLVHALGDEKGHWQNLLILSFGALKDKG